MFNRAAPAYNSALKSSGYPEGLTYMKGRAAGRRRNRSRNITWFNPPWSKSVSTNVAGTFLQLVDKNFPKGSKLYKIFNRNTLKVSYSCMPNFSSAIKSHNTRILEEKTKEPEGRTCNCRTNDCPLQGHCLATNIVYQAVVSTQDKAMTYIGLTEPPFKTRYGNHLYSFRNENRKTSTELSKYIWELKESKTPYNIAWSIVKHATPYTNVSKRCDLCTTEKLIILTADKRSLLNKRPEIVSKCRHQNKFYLAKFAREYT